jgi:hypothetical protein
MNTRTQALATSIATVLALVASPAMADSASSAASSASNSVGSSSTSLNTSSNSSSGNGRVAQGPYTVVEMAEVAAQPDMLQLRLHSAQATTDHPTSPFTLTLPRATAEREQLAVGQTVLAENRPYGLAFATVGAEGQAHAFFLVLEDAWYRELRNHPVGG